MAVRIERNGKRWHWDRVDGFRMRCGDSRAKRRPAPCKGCETAPLFPPPSGGRHTPTPSAHNSSNRPPTDRRARYESSATDALWTATQAAGRTFRSVKKVSSVKRVNSEPCCLWWQRGIGARGLRP
eukprot:3572260-Prymnesium_polylepis.1